jgi:hypothetical protein
MTTELVMKGFAVLVIVVQLTVIGMLLYAGIRDTRDRNKRS